MNGQQRNNNNGQNQNHFNQGGQQQSGIYTNDILCWLSNFHNRYNSQTLCRQIMETYSSNDILQACTTLKEIATTNNNTYTDSSVFFNDQMSLEEKTVRCMLYIFKLNKTERNVLPRFVSQGLHLPKVQHYTHVELQEPLQDLRDHFTEQVMLIRNEITSLKRMIQAKSTEESNNMNKITQNLLKFNNQNFKNFNTNNISGTNNQPGSKLNSIRDQLILKQAMNQKQQQLQNHLNKTSNILNFGATTSTSNFGLNSATSSGMDLGSLFGRSSNNSGTFQLAESSDGNNQNNGTDNEENKSEISAMEINQTQNDDASQHSDQRSTATPNNNHQQQQPKQAEVTMRSFDLSSRPNLFSSTINGMSVSALNEVIKKFSSGNLSSLAAGAASMASNNMGPSSSSTPNKDDSVMGNNNGISNGMMLSQAKNGLMAASTSPPGTYTLKLDENPLTITTE